MVDPDRKEKTDYMRYVYISLILLICFYKIFFPEYFIYLTDYTDGNSYNVSVGELVIDCENKTSISFDDNNLMTKNNRLSLRKLKLEGYFVRVDWCELRSVPFGSYNMELRDKNYLAYWLVNYPFYAFLLFLLIDKNLRIMVFGFYKSIKKYIKDNTRK